MIRVKMLIQKVRSRIALVRVVLALGGVASLYGCDDADDSTDDEHHAESASESPLYAMMVQVYDIDGEDRTVYVSLTDTLDIDSVDLKQAREFSGVANLAAIDGDLLISSGTEPTITKFSISEDFTWTERDEVSFAEYPFSDNANFYYQYVLNVQTAYMPYDITKRLIWNPTEMVIDEMRDDSKLEIERGSLLAEVGGNRNGIHFDGPVQQAFYFTDKDYFDFDQGSVIAIYDEKTHDERELISVPCPGLSMASQDEDGYTYYGTWTFQGTRALFGEGPKPCIARLKPDLTLDEDWTTDLRDLTDGRHVNNFRYIGKGRAIGNVLHHEMLDVDWDRGYDADVAETIDQSGEHWRLWLFDLDEGTAKPVDNIDVATSSGAQFAVLDGRTFVFLPYDDWGRTKIYELDAAGKATERADTSGDVFKWIRVR
jgi:hypothetical protein